MYYAFEEYMTEEMLQCLPDPADLRREVVDCLHRLVAARAAAKTPLPATAANGQPVRVGAKNTMDNIAAYWGTRIDAAKRLMGRSKENDAFFDSLGISVMSHGDYRNYGKPELVYPAK